jgi:hypothetical protein
VDAVVSLAQKWQTGVCWYGFLVTKTSPPSCLQKKFKAMSENYQNRKWGTDANG